MSDATRIPQFPDIRADKPGLDDYVDPIHAGHEEGRTVDEAQQDVDADEAAPAPGEDRATS